MRCYRKQRVKWRLTIRVFDLVAIDEVGIVVSGVGISGERAEVSYGGPAISKDQEKHPRNNWGKDFAGYSNGQTHLIERQEKGKS